MSSKAVCYTDVLEKIVWNKGTRYAGMLENCGELPLNTDKFPSLPISFLCWTHNAQVTFPGDRKGQAFYYTDIVLNVLEIEPLAFLKFYSEGKFNLSVHG